MKKHKLVISLFVFLLVAAFAWAQTYENVTVSRIVSVYDGDTFRCDIDEWPAIIGDNIGVRIAGIDTPELTDKRLEVKVLAMRAKKFTDKTLRTAGVIELKNLERGKYFRIVADVYVDGQSLAAMLIDAGLAIPYDGGKKSVWGTT